MEETEKWKKKVERVESIKNVQDGFTKLLKGGAFILYVGQVCNYKLDGVIYFVSELISQCHFITEVLCKRFLITEDRRRYVPTKHLQPLTKVNGFITETNIFPGCKIVLCVEKQRECNYTALSVYHFSQLCTCAGENGKGI
jgi:hypothetical protein